MFQTHLAKNQKLKLTKKKVIIISSLINKKHLTFLGLVLNEGIVESLG